VRDMVGWNEAFGDVQDQDQAFEEPGDSDREGGWAA
jgi:hypothetical protein